MRFVRLTLLFLIFLSCNTNEYNKSKLIQFVPENTFVIVKTSDFNGLQSSLENNDFFQKLSDTQYLKDFKNQMEFLGHIDPDGYVLICFSKDDKDSTQCSLITRYHNHTLNFDSLPNFTQETLKYKSKTITKYTINKPFYSTVTDSILFMSSSKKLVEASTNKHPLNSEFEKIYNTSDSEKVVSVILNNTIKSSVKSLFFNDSIPSKKLTNYLSVDIDLLQNELLINGIAKATDSTKSLLNVFKNNIPQENKVAQITPSNSDGFLSFTFNDFNEFRKNLSKYNAKDSISSKSTLFDNIIEVGVIYEDTEKAVILNSIDAISTKDALLSEQSLASTYRQVDIFNFSKPELFSNTFYPFINFKNATKYCVIDDFFVFSDEVETLQNIIANYQNKTTLSERDYFKEIKQHLSDEASLITVINGSILKNILSKNLQENLQITFDEYKTSALQFVYDTDFAHLNGIIKKTRAKAYQDAVSEELNIKLDADLLTNPQFVTNHYTREKEIVVQDINNNLYLISNKGKILWKKQLNGQVLGKIEQIDIYKNGRLQLLFATPHRVYLLDRNGEDVAPFPGKFKDEITQPLSVFDYDNKKNYRLAVTQGKHVLMYTKFAETVKGFTFNSAENTIIHQPQHFRIGTKDYIVVKTENKFYILDRTGKIRIKPKTSYTYSDQSVYVYNDKFTTTTQSGDLVTIDEKGNVASQNLNLTVQHNIDATSKTLITHYENKLSIKGKTVELDYGTYTTPKIFYIYDKIYVAITDLQAQKIYLFDSQARLLPNFPIYGNSVIDLDDIDNDKNLEFIVRGEDNSIILYKIN